MNKTITDNEGECRVRIDSGRYTIFKRRLLPVLATLFLSLGWLTTSAQKIDIQLNNAPFREVVKELRKKQPEYSFSINERHLKQATPITVNRRQTEFLQVLKAVFEGQPFTYKIDGKQVVSVDRQVKNSSTEEQQEQIRGRVTDEDGEPLAGATIRIKGTNVVFITDSKGNFEIPYTYRDATMQVEYIGYKQVELTVQRASNITLLADQSEISNVDVVVNTGYQSVPKERSTGSFAVVDSALFHRRTSTNILDRLDGVTSGLIFNGLATTGIRTSPDGGSLGITIRGESTIRSSVDPLIVLDNFPYHGNISNLNPNDIENVTVLKDAAAASIWGARAGNGVIVITTKKGKLNSRMSIDFSSSVNVTNKPDIFADKNYMTPSQYIEVERLLFDNNYFNGDINNANKTALSPVIDLLVKQRNGDLTESELQTELDYFRNQDVRKDFEKYVYRNQVNQQYYLSMRGGSNKNTYLISAGLDDNRDNMINKGFKRSTVNAQNTFIPFQNLEFTTAINYSYNTTLNQNMQNRYDSPYGISSKYARIFPYAGLADDKGNPLSLTKDYISLYKEEMMELGYLDWNFRPLEEIMLADDTRKVTETLFKVGAKYNFMPYLSAEVIYQNQHQVISGRDHQSQDTYFVRNQINRFGQYDPTDGSIDYIFPLGGVLDISSTDWRSNNLRGQLNFNKNLNKHQLNGILGGELREQKVESFSRTSYGYDDQFGTSVSNLNYISSFPTNPVGSARITAPGGSTYGNLQRFISYYTNLSYDYDTRYTANFSARKDGSNFFGVNANNRFTPLWSAGIGWNISNEAFYNSDILKYLKLRATYGYNGNIGTTPSQLTGRYMSGLLPVEYIFITNPPNPELRWEKVKNINIGIDFGALQNRVAGTIELFRKEGLDLLQPTPIAPQTGFATFISNAASTSSKGIDVIINTKILNKTFRWNTTLLYSYIADKVIHYDVEPTASSIQIQKVLMIDRPMFGVYSYGWAGLDPLNGDPRGYLNGEISKDYNGIINNFEPDSLVFHGSARPTSFGSFRNELSYKNFSLSANISFKLGYSFRRPSIRLNYRDVLMNHQHEDYSIRWKSPGDEKFTNIPSMTYPDNTQRNTFYRFSEALVERGDHIRLQDIRFTYTIPHPILSQLSISRLQCYTYMNNLGILWRKNKRGIDPDTYGAVLPNPFSIAFGLNMTF